MTRSTNIDSLRSRKSEIKEWMHFETLAVFSSYARDEETEHSDLNVPYRIDNTDRLGLVEVDELEKHLTELVDVPAVDLVNQTCTNPIIELKVGKELVHI